MQGQNQHQLLRTVESPSSRCQSEHPGCQDQTHQLLGLGYRTALPLFLGENKNCCALCRKTWYDLNVDRHSLHSLCISYFCIFLHTCFGQGNLDTGMATTLWYMLIQFADHRGWKSIKTQLFEVDPSHDPMAINSLILTEVGHPSITVSSNMVCWKITHWVWWVSHSLWVFANHLSHYISTTIPLYTHSTTLFVD